MYVRVQTEDKSHERTQEGCFKDLAMKYRGNCKYSDW